MSASREGKQPQHSAKKCLLQSPRKHSACNPGACMFAMLLMYYAEFLAILLKRFLNRSSVLTAGGPCSCAPETCRSEIYIGRGGAGHFVCGFIPCFWAFRFCCLSFDSDKCINLLVTLTVYYCYIFLTQLLPFFFFFNSYYMFPSPLLHFVPSL